MQDPINVTVVCRKGVETEIEAKAVYALIKERLADEPNIKVNGNFSKKLDDTE